MLTVRPLVPVALAFTLGVALGLHAEAVPDWSGPAALALLVCFVIAVLLRRRRLAAAVGLPLFVALGLLATMRVGQPPGNATIDSGAPLLVRGRVDGPISRTRDGGVRFLVREEQPSACSAKGAILVTVQEGDPGLARGDAVRFRARVRSLSGRRNPGAMDWPLFWSRRGVVAEARVKRAAGVVRLEPGRGLLAAVDRARGRVASVLAGRGRAEQGLVLALVTGERGFLPPALRQRFSDAGLAHLLAVSGLHIAAVVGAMFFLVQFLLSRSRRLLLAINVRGAAAAVAILGGWGYALLAGATPATLRAAVLATVLLGALVVRRRPDMWSALALAALGILAVDPAALAGASFQLTFAAVIAIVTLTPRLLEALQRRLPQRAAARLQAGPWRRLAQVPLCTLAALIGTGPLVAMHFGRVSPAGLLTNLVGVPLASLVVVPLALISGLAALLWPAAAQVLLAGVAEPAAGLLLGLARLGAELPGAGLELARPGWAGVIGWYLLVVGVVSWRRRGGRWLAVAAVAALSLLAGWRMLGPSLSRELVVTFLDVGRGDAVVLQFPGGATALVDGGSAGRGFALASEPSPSPAGSGETEPSRDAGETSLLPALEALGVRSLERVYLTHGHEDHHGGLRAVLQRIEVGGLIHDGQAPDLAGVDALLDVAAERAVPIRAARHGEVWRVGETTVVVRHPADDDRDLIENDHSLVLEVRYGRVGFLLTGDIEAAAEARLLMRGERIRADVLKLAHHGSNSSSGLDFLEAVSPRLAVVTAGARWGLPDPGVRDRLDALDAQVLTTGECGAVTVTTDGDVIEVDSFGLCPAVKLAADPR